MKILSKISIKEFLGLFLIILIPNILRQVIYYITFLRTNSIDFIDSFETKLIYSTFPFIGLLEEIIIGVVFVFIWFNFKKLRFFSYGWINDALFDFVSVLVWFIFGSTPLQFLGFGIILRFAIREVIIPYVILGPLTYSLKLNIKKLSIIYSIIGILIISIIAIF